MHSIDVEWLTPNDGGDEIYEYALQLASYEVNGSHPTPTPTPTLTLTPNPALPLPLPLPLALTLTLTRSSGSQTRTTSSMTSARGGLSTRAPPRS